MHRESTVFASSVLDRLGAFELALAVRRRGWGPQGLTVMLFHRVTTPDAIGEMDPGTIDATPVEFDAQMAYLRRNFHPVSVEEVLAAHRGGPPLPPHSVLVTFDDGFRDNYEQAFPILQRHDVRALFFVTTEMLTARTLFWWERVYITIQRSRARRLALSYPLVETLPLSTRAEKAAAVDRCNRIIKAYEHLDLARFLDGVAAAAGVPWDREEERRIADGALMTWEHVKAMRAAGMGIGSHSHSHRVLQTLSPEVLRADLTDSRAALEQRLGESVTTIAYPVGKSIAASPAVRAAVVEAGYELGFTTRSGLNPLASCQDPLDLHRVCAERGTPASLARMRLALPFLVS
jgi:peptidoglycan/xylan/chitin deacetylase (PgdA/CDA1 family)